MFCLLVFGFNVDGLEFVACLPENLSLVAMLLHPWLVQMLAMETSPQILLPAGMCESLAGMVCATA